MKGFFLDIHNRRIFTRQQGPATAGGKRHELLQLAAKFSGFSLLELMGVILILSIVAAVTIPNFSSTDPAKLDLAANEVMQAIRLARSESMRSGEMHGLTISQNTQIIEVKKYDLTTDPVSTDYKLTHPLEKQVYEFNIEHESLTRGVRITNSLDAFWYSDFQRRKSVLFDHTGAPVWFKGNNDKVYQLWDGRVELSYGDSKRTLLVAPMTGRVTLQ